MISPENIREPIGFLDSDHFRQILRQVLEIPEIQLPKTFTCLIFLEIYDQDYTNHWSPKVFG